MKLRATHLISATAVALCACYVEPEHRPGPPAGEYVVEQPPAPPPPQADPPPPPPPSPDASWVAGYQRWDGHAYQWEKGHYERRPQPNAHWVAGHWERHGQANAWVDAHWE